jgi:hypothetical protein
MQDPRIHPVNSLASAANPSVSWTASRAHPDDIVDADDPELGYLFVEVSKTRKPDGRPLASDEVARRRLSRSYGPSGGPGSHST